MTEFTDDIDEITQDEWDNDEFMELEETLTYFQLRILIAAVSPEEGMGIYEPVWPWLAEASNGKPTPPIYSAALLRERELLQMAQARQLERLALVELDIERAAWRLTAKGIAALRWYLGCLVDEWPNLVGIDPPQEKVSEEKMPDKPVFTAYPCPVA